MSLKVHVRNDNTGELEAHEATPDPNDPTSCWATIDGIPYRFATPGTYPSRQGMEGYSRLEGVRVLKHAEKTMLVRLRDGAEDWLPFSLLGPESVKDEGDVGTLVVKTWKLEQSKLAHAVR